MAPTKPASTTRGRRSFHTMAWSKVDECRCSSGTCVSSASSTAAGDRLTGPKEIPSSIATTRNTKAISSGPRGRTRPSVPAGPGAKTGTSNSCARSVVDGGAMPTVGTIEPPFLRGLDSSAQAGVRARPDGQYRCGTAPGSHRSSLDLCRLSHSGRGAATVALGLPRRQQPGKGASGLWGGDYDGQPSGRFLHVGIGRVDLGIARRVLVHHVTQGASQSHESVTSGQLPGCGHLRVAAQRYPGDPETVQGVLPIAHALLVEANVVYQHVEPGMRPRCGCAPVGGEQAPAQRSEADHRWLSL